MGSPTRPAAGSSRESTYLAPRFGLIEFLRRIREDQLSTLVPGAFDRARQVLCVICSQPDKAVRQVLGGQALSDALGDASCC